MATVHGTILSHSFSRSFQSAAPAGPRSGPGPLPVPVFLSPSVSCLHSVTHLSEVAAPPPPVVRDHRPTPSAPAPAPAPAPLSPVTRGDTRACDVAAADSAGTSAGSSGRSCSGKGTRQHSAPVGRQGAEGGAAARRRTAVIAAAASSCPGDGGGEGRGGGAPIGLRLPPGVVAGGQERGGQRDGWELKWCVMISRSLEDD